MGVERLGDNEREFLKTFFEKAVRLTRVGIEESKAAGVYTAGHLANAFFWASVAAKDGDQDRVDATIETAKAVVREMTGQPGVKKIMDAVLQMQDALYDMTPPEKRLGLGGYKYGIFS